MSQAREALAKEYSELVEKYAKSRRTSVRHEGSVEAGITLSKFKEQLALLIETIDAVSELEQRLKEGT